MATKWPCIRPFITSFGELFSCQYSVQRSSPMTKQQVKCHTKRIASQTGAFSLLLSPRGKFLARYMGFFPLTCRTSHTAALFSLLCRLVTTPPSLLAPLGGSKIRTQDGSQSQSCLMALSKKAATPPVLRTVAGAS